MLFEHLVSFESEDPFIASIPETRSGRSLKIQSKPPLSSEMTSLVGGSKDFQSIHQLGSCLSRKKKK